MHKTGRRATLSNRNPDAFSAAFGSENMQNAQEELDRVRQQNTELLDQIEALNKVQATILAQNEGIRELLKKVIKGGLDGKITAEECKRLGMTEKEITEIVQKIKENEESDNVSYRKLESAVRTWYSVKAGDPVLAKPGMGMSNLRIQDSENDWAIQAQKATSGNVSVDELRRII